MLNCLLLGSLIVYTWLNISVSDARVECYKYGIFFQKQYGTYLEKYLTFANREA